MEHTYAEELDLTIKEWRESVKQELRDLGYTKTIDCEICENGDVYFGNLSLATGLVTSLEDYIDKLDRR